MPTDRVNILTGQMEVDENSSIFQIDVEVEISCSKISPILIPLSENESEQPLISGPKSASVIRFIFHFLHSFENV